MCSSVKLSLRSVSNVVKSEKLRSTSTDTSGAYKKLVLISNGNGFINELKSGFFASEDSNLAFS